MASSQTLEDAIQLAVDAHRGVLDKGGQPYILHPLRLMVQMETAEDRIVAVLHDVVEDTDRRIDDLANLGYPPAIVQAVDALTRRKAEGETYEDFIERLRPNPVARHVKLADLADNMDIRRLGGELSPEDLERLQRYRRAWAVLTDETRPGTP